MTAERGAKRIAELAELAEQRAQCRRDGVTIREFMRSAAWPVLRRHLEDARDRALRRLDTCAPSETDDSLYWRAFRAGVIDALGMPDAIVANAAEAERRPSAAQS